MPVYTYPLCLPAAARSFDPSSYCQRYVALEVMYFGWNFNGFARQENTDDTIEVCRGVVARVWGSVARARVWGVVVGALWGVSGFVSG